MANPSSTAFDEELLRIPHFRAIPAMLPYVGGDFSSASHGKLLLIAESFYFPDESTIHQDPEAWYRSSQEDLDVEEISYINCRGLLECAWEAPGHEIYREINRCLKEVVDTFEDRAVSHVAFSNAFYRPASTPGESIRHCCTVLDIEKGVEITSEVIRCLEPDLVVFVSKFTWDTVGWRVAEKHPQIQMDFTAHAADRRWFYRGGYPHAKPKLMRILKEVYIKQPSLK